MRNETQTTTRQIGAPTRRRPGHEHNLRLSAGNVHGIRARCRGSQSSCGASSPTWVCLQETPLPGSGTSPTSALRALGYRATALARQARRRRGDPGAIRPQRQPPQPGAGRQARVAAGPLVETTCAGLTIGSVYVPACLERREHEDAGKLAIPGGGRQPRPAATTTTRC